MSSALMMTLMFAGPVGPVWQSSAFDVSGSGQPSAVRTQRDLRTTYSRLLRDSSRRALPEPIQIVPRLVALYRELEHHPAVLRAEASRMRRGLKTRLVQMQSRILRDRRRQSQHGHRSPDKQRHLGLVGGGAQNGMSQLIDLIQTNIAPDSWNTAGIGGLGGNALGGGTTGSGAIDLVELIQQTIAPDTWDVNGGFGSITLFGK